MPTIHKDNQDQMLWPFLEDSLQEDGLVFVLNNFWGKLFYKWLILFKKVPLKLKSSTFSSF